MIYCVFNGTDIEVKDLTKANKKFEGFKQDNSGGVVTIRGKMTYEAA